MNLEVIHLDMFKRKFNDEEVHQAKEAKKLRTVQYEDKMVEVTCTRCMDTLHMMDRILKGPEGPGMETLTPKIIIAVLSGSILGCLE